MGWLLIIVGVSAVVSLATNYAIDRLFQRWRRRDRRDSYEAERDRRLGPRR
jgi:hypothetical protein